MKKELKTDLEKIAYNCRKATFLIEKKQGEELTAREKLELKIHLAGCNICRIYERQSLLINTMVHQLRDTLRPADAQLDQDYLNELQKLITAKLGET